MGKNRAKPQRFLLLNSVISSYKSLHEKSRDSLILTKSEVRLMPVTFFIFSQSALDYHTSAVLSSTKTSKTVEINMQDYNHLRLKMANGTCSTSHSLGTVRVYIGFSVRHEHILLGHMTRHSAHVGWVWFRILATRVLKIRHNQR